MLTRAGREIRTPVTVGLGTTGGALAPELEIRLTKCTIPLANPAVVLL